MKKIFLREDCSVQIISLDEAPFFNLELKGFRKMLFKNLSEGQIELVKRLKSNLGFNFKERKLSKDQVALLKVFYKKKLLIEVQNQDDRTGLFLAHMGQGYSNYQEKLREKTVLILGCGGTGAIIADHLARSGLKNFVLVDGATLDLPDLNRQFPFSKQGLGKNKALLLANYSRKNFSSRVKALPFFLENSESFSRLNGEKFDLIFNCADKPVYRIQAWALDYAIEHGSPIVLGSVGINDYLVGPLLVSKHSKKRYRKAIELTYKKEPVDHPIKSSICFSNSLAAIQIAWLGFRFLLDDPEVRKFYGRRLVKVFPMGVS